MTPSNTNFLVQSSQGNQMKLTVKIGNNYGKKVVYPVCEQSRIFAMIAGTTTLTLDTLRLINELGYTLEIERPTMAGVE